MGSQEYPDGQASIDCSWRKSDDGWLPPPRVPDPMLPVVRRVGNPRPATAGQLTHADVGRAVRPGAGMHRGTWFPIEALQLHPEWVYVHVHPEYLERGVTLLPGCPVWVCDRLAVLPAAQPDLEEPPHARTA